MPYTTDTPTHIYAFVYSFELVQTGQPAVESKSSTVRSSNWPFREVQTSRIQPPRASDRVGPLASTDNPLGNGDAGHTRNGASGVSRALGRPGSGLVQRHCVSDEGYEGLFIDLVSVGNIDGATDVGVETGVEETRWVVE